MLNMNPNEIETHETFSELFTINPELVKRIEQNMREKSYDLSQPIVLATWKGQDDPVCIDGHTRLQAAKDAGLERVTVWLRDDFETEEDALKHAIKLQRNRRNMTDAEIAACIRKLDNRRPRGGDRKSEDVKSTPQDCGNENGRSASAKELAETLGISPRKVEQTRTVMDHAEPDIVEAVRKEEMSINKAYQETQKRRKEAKRQESERGDQSQGIEAVESAGSEECEDGGESQQIDAEDMDSDEDEDDDLDTGESGAVETEKQEEVMSGGEMAVEDGRVSVGIPLAQYEALSKYDGTVEEMVEHAIERYLKGLEREKDYDRAKYEEMWASDEEDEESDVEAA